MGGKAGLQPLLCLAAQLLRLVAGGLGESRQDRFHDVRHEGAAPCDHQRVLDRLRQVGEQRAHLGRAFESVLGREPTAIGLADIGALGNAEQRIVSLEHAPYQARD